jgi:hypothetical protein
VVVAHVVRVTDVAGSEEPRMWVDAALQQSRAEEQQAEQARGGGASGGLHVVFSHTWDRPSPRRS